MELDETIRKRLESCSITEDDALAILDWQLSLPAEDMDCDLIRECDLFLSPDAEGLGEARADALFARITAAIDAEAQAEAPANQPHRRRPKAPAHRRPGKLMAVILLAALLLALSIGSVAYTYHRGVLNFTEDFGFAPMVAQDGAEEFVQSGSLAHAEFEHVIVDVLEAVYDGADLRVVYSLIDKSGELTLAEHTENGYEMPGAKEGEVHMCDAILVNGQDAYFYDTWEMPGDEPGQMLYYLQTSLPAWGVDVSGAETLTIGLPMLPRVEGVPGPGVIEFTIPAAVPEGLVRGAVLKEDAVGGHPVSVAKAVFSPLSGFLQLRIEGLTEDTYRRDFTGWASIYDMNGDELTACHPEKDEFTEEAAMIGFTITPPEGDWPEEMILALEFNDYSPDWEVTVCVEPRADKE